MSNELLYVYGVVPADEGRDLGPVGLNGSNVRTLDCGAIGVLVGQAAASDFATLSPDQMLRGLGDHQRTLEAALAGGTVVPVKFDTVLAGEAAVRRAIRSGESALMRALGRCAGKVEVDLSVRWADLQAVLADLAGHEEVLAVKAEAAEGAPLSLQQRVRLGRLVKDLLDRQRRSAAAAILSALDVVHAEIIVNPPRDDSNVLDAAVLIGRDQQTQVGLLVQRLGQCEGSRLEFRSAGPLPPCSFATVSVRHVPAEALASACAEVELTWPTSLPQLLTAHRRLLRELHPDRNPAPQAARRLAKVSASFELLRACVAAIQGQDDPGDGATLITVRSVQDLRASAGLHTGQAA